MALGSLMSSCIWARSIGIVFCRSLITSRACFLAVWEGCTEKCASFIARSIWAIVYGRVVSGLMQRAATSFAISVNRASESFVRSSCEQPGCPATQRNAIALLVSQGCSSDLADLELAFGQNLQDDLGFVLGSVCLHQVGFLGNLPFRDVVEDGVRLDHLIQVQLFFFAPAHDLRGDHGALSKCGSAVAGAARECHSTPEESGWASG